MNVSKFNEVHLLPELLHQHNTNNVSIESQETLATRVDTEFMYRRYRKVSKIKVEKASNIEMRTYLITSERSERSSY